MASTPEMSGTVRPPLLERAVRFAAFLIGAVVALAYGAAQLATAAAELLECTTKYVSCPTGVSQLFYDESAPALVAGSVLVALAIALFAFAYRLRA